MTNSFRGVAMGMAVLIAPIFAFAQSPGNVTVNDTTKIVATVVNATAGVLSSTVRLDTVDVGKVAISCNQGATLLMDATAYPQLTAHVVSCHVGADAITIMVQKITTGGSLKWSVTANGTLREGVL